MPSNWLSVDDNFPTFTGAESPQEQIAALHDYLYQMRQGLQYSLRNLSAENFNASALQQLTDEQKNAVLKELELLINTVSQLSGRLGGLDARVVAVEKLGTRVTGAEEAITYLQEDVEALKQHECDLSELQNTAQELRAEQEELLGHMTGAEEAIFDLQEEQKRISEVAKVAEDGSVVVGAEGKKLYLVGEIYINGQLYESGGGTA